MSVWILSSPGKNFPSSGGKESVILVVVVVVEVVFARLGCWRCEGVEREIEVLNVKKAFIVRRERRKSRQKGRGRSTISYVCHSP